MPIHKNEKVVALNKQTDNPSLPYNYLFSQDKGLRIGL